MQLFIDTNIILDVLLEREDFYIDSTKILQQCESGIHQGWISLITVANINYIGTKLVGQKTTLESLKILINYLNVVGGDTQVVRNALKNGFNDFEDALQYHSALAIKGMEIIITRDNKDYKNSRLPVFNPTEFLRMQF